MSLAVSSTTTEPLLDRRADFPILSTEVHGKPLVYLDNGATTQKPDAVIKAEDAYYRLSNANIHRGVHWLSQHATELYDEARRKVQQYLHAARPEEIVFTQGRAVVINFVSYSWVLINLRSGDEILLTELEHHWNIVPWQLVARQTGAVIRVAPVLDTGALDLEAFYVRLNERTRLVGIVHVSNALGTINPIQEMIAAAHKVGAKVLIDGAQAVAHLPVDVQALDCDFYAFSGHKLYGPTGIGILYAKYDLLEAMPPWQGGGDMIHTDRKSTRLNSSHVASSYAVFCLKKKKKVTKHL